MKKLLILSTAVVGLVVGPAVAADLRAPPPPRFVAYNWNGCYIGINGGGAWQKADNVLTVTNGADPYFNPAVLPEVSNNGTRSLESDSVIAGGQVGCNYQTGGIVWGVEGDINWMSHHEHFGGGFRYSTDNSPYSLEIFEEKKWFGTVRGRVGLTATDRVLLYVTGGFAALNVEFTQTFSEPPFTSPPLGTPQIASFSKTKGGWTAGAGIEAGVWSNVTVKAEYLYARFEGETVAGSFTGGDAIRSATLSNSVSDINLHIFRLGLNFRFGGAATSY